jgi:cysteinyl-tRNA synthetase
MLSVYNTLTRRKEPIKPLQPGGVSVYSCGPTVYRDVHIGNLRTYLLADWLRRALEFEGLRVKHVKNITDVGHMRQELLERGEDKVVAAALAAGKRPQQIAEEYTQRFMRDEAALGIAPAHVFPKATEHVGEMIAMIEQLLKRGMAYEVEGNVYYNAGAFASYGALSGNTGESLLEGVRSEADPQKRDPRDFALWKAAEEGRVMKWASPWGDGFPGWHIECSAMSTKHLGEEFDIHTGGVDNIFPHHEDERAQSEGALGKQVVRYWVHGQHLLVDGLKMAKSTGNVYTLRDLQARGFEAMAFRYLCATAHYRHRLNFTFDALRAAAIGLNRLRQEAFFAAQASSQNGGSGDRWEQAFTGAIHDDLHIPRALAVTWQMLRSDAPAGVKARLLQRFDLVLGFDLFGSMVALPDAVRVMVDEREELRRGESFAEADRLRDRIRTAGFHVRDTRAGPAVVPLLPAPPVTLEGVRSSSDVPSFLAKDDAVDFSIVITCRDDLESLRRATDAALRHAPDAKTEVIVVDNGSTDGTEGWLSELTRRDKRVHAIRSDHNIGVGAARNCGLLAARGTYVVLVDTSIEFTGDVLSSLSDVLDDPSTGVAGAFGVSSENIRDFEDAPGPDVDAVEGYLMAFRRDRIRDVGLMDEKFRFYRHLDLDYSFAFRGKGYRNRIVRDVPVRRHAHTDWERTPPEERDRLSKRNFYRFLHKYGHREDLLLSNGPAAG